MTRLWASLSSLLLLAGCAGVRPQTLVTEWPVSNSYALAYSSGRHWVSTPQGVALLFASSSVETPMSFWLATTSDGFHWKRQPVFLDGDAMAIASAYWDGTKVVVATSSYSHKALSLCSTQGLPTRIMQNLLVPESIVAPNATPDGIVFRSYLQGAHPDEMRLSILWQKTKEVERVTTDEEENDTAAGTSGQLIQVDGQWAIVWSGARQLHISWKTPQGWHGEVIDPAASGVHDVSAVSLGSILLVAALHQGGDLVIWRWTRQTGWQVEQTLGPTETHSVNCWPANDTVETVQVLQSPRRLQVWRRDYNGKWVAWGKPVLTGATKGYVWVCGWMLHRRTLLAWTAQTPEGIRVCVARVQH